MFDPPSEEDAIWKLPHQQQILNWRYFHSCSVHCLTVEAAHIYMLTEVKYPLPPRVCKAMLEKKLLGDRKDEEVLMKKILQCKLKFTSEDQNSDNSYLRDILGKDMHYPFTRQADQAGTQSHPSSFTVPPPLHTNPCTKLNPTPFPPPPPTPITKPTSEPSSPSTAPEHETMEHPFEQPSPEHQPSSPRQESDIP
ncbi:hypothetical protein Tco_0321527 [Tanacetum coccineum]